MPTAGDCHCPIQCLDQEAADSAWRRIDKEPAVKVPYRCKISGEIEELVLISTQEAEKISQSDQRLQSALDSMLAVAVSLRPACECDLATLLRKPVDLIKPTLVRLSESGVHSHDVLHDMDYLRLSETKLRAYVSSFFSS